MKKQNTNSGKGKNKEKSELDNLQEEYPDLTYEEIEDCDQALEDYLNICMEMYWARVKDGTFPWPDEDFDYVDSLDSTH